MSGNPWGVGLPPPRTESKFFNAARRTVSLLVEAGIDQRFWRMHCARDCHVRDHGQGGREAVLRALDTASGDPEAVLLAVLDADLDRLEGCLAERPDLVWTDSHDLETTLLALTLDKLLSQILDPAKLRAAEERWREPFRSRLFRHATGLGRLRWLKLRQRPDLDDIVFKKPLKRDVTYFDKYSECASDDWTPALVQAIKKILDFSAAHHLQRRDLAAECEALPAADPSQLCNGHDLLGFLRAGLLTLGSRLTVDELAERLAAACERAWLIETAMWRDLQSWERAHPGYRVLKTEAEHAARP